jgi:anti-sigma-K factor RskA
MSNPDHKARLEELAALNAFDMLDEASLKELLEAARDDKEAAQLMRDFSDTAALMAYEAPENAPPPNLRAEILHQLPARKSSGKIVPFPQWLPFAIAAGLMVLGICQTVQIFHLKTQLLTTSTDAEQLRHSNALLGLRIATLQAQDATYVASRITVAWDPYEHRGVIALQDLPLPPAGKDYQLWVLDPNAPSPVSAGLITAARPFHTDPISTQNPGFAISLEPAGGSPSPTGPILFAVAPGS